MPHLSFKEDEKKEGPYPYELAACAYLFNRSDGQVKLLFELCDRKLDFYMNLEMAIKRQRIAWCPGNKREMYRVLWLDTFNKKELRLSKSDNYFESRAFFDIVNWYE